MGGMRGFTPASSGGWQTLLALALLAVLGFAFAWEGEPTPREPPAGLITPSPPVCQIPEGASVCSITLSWWANRQAVSLWRSGVDGSGSVRVAQLQNGTYTASDIGSVKVRFTLKMDKTGEVLDIKDVRGNLAPAVSLTSPVPNTYLAPASIPLAATASDADGGVQRVEFWASGSRVATVSTAPYQANWTGVAAGTYDVQALAFDNEGHARWSTAARIVVREPVRGAEPVDQVVSTSVLMGRAQTVTIRMRNTGDFVWRASEGYRLGSQNPVDNTIWSVQRVTLPTDVAPGQIATFSFTITAPQAPGTYNFQWRMLQEGVTWFGSPTPNISITVRPSDVIGHVEGVAISGGQLFLQGWACSTEVNQSIDVHLYAGGPWPSGTAIASARASLPNEPAVTSSCQTSGAPHRFQIPLPASLRQQHGGKTLYVHGISPVGRENRLLSASGSHTLPALPAVAITSPANGTVVNGPISYPLTATANAPVGTITKVEFYNGQNLVGVDSNSPYGLTWSNLPPGSYTITAKAYDNVGAVNSSSPVTLVVNGDPTIRITKPVSGAVVVAPAAVLIEATAADPDTGDAVALVEFYVNGVHKATDTSAPFTLQANNLPAGTYSLRAKAYDNRGGASWADAVELVVTERPAVSLVSPAGETKIVAPATIHLVAAANDPDGTITRVEFYSGATLLGTAVTSPYQLSWTLAGSGDHSVRARAYDNRGIYTDSTAVLVRARTDALSLVEDGAQADLGGELPPHDATVGRTPGSAGVSGGAANYIIPIVVPPGRRGVQPELKVEYSSRAGNGPLGMGWSLTGLTSITRCPSTLDQDGMVRPVDFSANDKLCLDGQRLTLVSGTYGQPGAVYATEIESFVRVTQLGGGLSSPSTYFKAETKSGDILYYGGTSTAASASRVVPGGTTLPLSWLVERREDRVGNFVRYVYSSFAEGETLPTAILYTGFRSTDGDRRVEFTYETRPVGSGINDRASSYLAGTVTRQTQRLKAVTTYVGSEIVRQYRLDYGSYVSRSTGRSLLRALQECAYNGGVATCRPATQFVWQEGAPTFQWRANPASLAGITGGVADRFGREVGDFNGDGAIEFTYYAAHSDRTDLHLVTMSPERMLSWSMLLPASIGTFEPDLAADFDQDGKMDLPVWRSGQLTIYFWRGPPTASTFAEAFTDSWNSGIGSGNAVFEFSPHAGDMDLDGRADLVTYRYTPEYGDGCTYVADVHLNRAPASGSGKPLAFDHAYTACLHSRAPDGMETKRVPESVDRIVDFNGDGLPDIWLRAPSEDAGTPPLRRILLGQKGSAYSLSPVAFSSFFPAGDPMTAEEGEDGLFSMWSDINGDGLADFLYARLSGQWTIRLNRGNGLGPRIQLNDGRGLEAWMVPTGIKTWRPRYAARINSGDIDADGRDEILIPRRFAARVGTTILIRNREGGMEDIELYPEDPATGYSEPGSAGLYTWDKGGLDQSAYFMDALRFVEVAPNQFEIQQVQTNIINGFRKQGDLFGDGLSDSLTRVFCRYTGLGGCLPMNIDPFGNPVPLVPNPNAPLVYLNENLGTGRMNPDGKTPQVPDMLAMVTDGLGVQTVWTYSPLSGKAGRGPAETPLYTVPATGAERYVDSRHIYFTSSMPVVADMFQSDGVGGYRAWHYGYSEAMYNVRGRGFQGFRTIIEEDDASGLRTTIRFHQKFPLTSQIEESVVNPIGRSGSSGAVSRERYTWRCDRSDRSNVTACSVANAPVFVYLDTKETWSYDAAMAAAGGDPAPLSYVRELNADDPTCTGAGSAQSGYDAYGNLVARTTIVQDVASGSGGYRAFLALQCTRESASFNIDVGAWWLDRLAEKTVSTTVHWSTDHALPAGVANPTQILTHRYEWNADRTLANETLQPGIAEQQVYTAYTYPSPSYGLPETVSVVAAGDPNGTRTTLTTYSADGYFPIGSRNPLGHWTLTAVRLRDGQPTSVTDPNGLRTLSDYDAFGQVTRIRYRGRTDDEYVAPDKRIAVQRLSSSAHIPYQVVEVQDGSPTKLTAYDILGRPRFTSQKQFDGTWATDSHIEYTPRGLIARQSEPYRTGEPVYWTTFEYDVLGRTVRQVAPQQGEDGRGDRVTTYAYRGRQTAIRVCGTADTAGASCLDLSRTTDALGRVVETLDARGGRTRFWYGPSNNALALEDANGSVTRASYNALGQRIAVADPNQGTWTFGYNALGELMTQTDARGIVTTFAYDRLGRPTTRSANVDATGDGAADTVVDAWTYDPANGVGKAASSQRTINGVLERNTTTTYDALSRPVQVDVNQALQSGAASYRMRTRYDSYYGRPLGQEYPNGEAVEFIYSPYGHVVQERDPATGTIYRRLGGVNARHQPTLETFGDALQTRASYLAATGQVTELLHQANGIQVRRLEYGYDLYGNVARQTLNGGLTQETYRYDELHRLIEATRTGAASGRTQYGYDAAGNFRYKSDFSTTASDAYRYTGGSCGGGPNAVKSVTTSAGTRTYCYDANGNLTADNVGLGLSYDHQNLTVVARRGAVRDDFRYGPDGQRTRSWGSDGARVYLPGYEHRTDTGTTKVYIGDYAVVTHGGGGGRKVEYLLKDRLGSVDAVADASGALTETRGYDAFGKPRSGTWADLSPARLENVGATPKGFTQHEHLNQLELIHMNGRVYDYHLGRFTGVDPFIQFPLNSQSLNPYSYILNNPLSGTDPSGYAAIQDCSSVTNVGTCSYTETGSHIRKTSTVTVGNGQVRFSGGSSVGGRLVTSSGTYALSLSNGAVSSVQASAGNSRESSAAASGKGRPGSGVQTRQVAPDQWITGEKGESRESLLRSVAGGVIELSDKDPIGSEYSSYLYYSAEEKQFAVYFTGGTGPAFSASVLQRREGFEIVRDEGVAITAHVHGPAIALDRRFEKALTTALMGRPDAVLRAIADQYDLYSNVVEDRGRVVRGLVQYTITHTRNARGNRVARGANEFSPQDYRGAGYLFTRDRGRPGNIIYQRRGVRNPGLDINMTEGR